ncbi:MAG: 30S ribosome-binding factor RbfA [Campylobacterota bacterium]
MSKSIKLAKVESLLKEVLPEALATLDDKELSGLSVLDVRCSKGKYDAKVYLDKSFFSPKEQKELQKRLKKANGLIKAYVLNATSWYRCPEFNFIFDDVVDKTMHLEQLFKQIEKELDGK